MSIINFPTYIITEHAKISLYVTDESGFPDFVYNPDSMAWDCQNCSVNPGTFDGEQVVTALTIPEEIVYNTSKIWYYDPLGTYSKYSIPPMPYLLEVFETYTNDGHWIRSEHWMITNVTEQGQRYERTPRPAVGAATIIPLMAVLAVGALGVLLANNSGGGRIESR